MEKGYASRARSASNLWELDWVRPAQGTQAEKAGFPRVPGEGRKSQPAHVSAGSPRAHVHACFSSMTARSLRMSLGTELKWQCCCLQAWKAACGAGASAKGGGLSASLLSGVHVELPRRAQCLRGPRVVNVPPNKSAHAPQPQVLHSEPGNLSDVGGRRSS